MKATENSKLLAVGPQWLRSVASSSEPRYRLADGVSVASQ